MNKNRLEAFSDGVIAIIITIMVLEFKVPHSPDCHALEPLIPTFISYVLSFAFVGIYWNNHHHLLQTVKHISASIMWANLNLLFWLSLVPFVTAWMGENHFAAVPVAVYAVVMCCCGVAFNMLRRFIMSSHPNDHEVTEMLGKQSTKTLLSTICFLSAIPLAFLHTGISLTLFAIVAVMWFIPDRNIEKGVNG